MTLLSWLNPIKLHLIVSKAARSLDTPGVLPRPHLFELAYFHRSLNFLMIASYILLNYMGSLIYPADLHGDILIYPEQHTYILLNYMGIVIYILNYMGIASYMLLRQHMPLHGLLLAIYSHHLNGADADAVDESFTIILNRRILCCTWPTDKIVPWSRR